MKNIISEKESSLTYLIKSFFKQQVNSIELEGLINEIGEIKEEERLELEKTIIKCYYEKTDENERMNFKANIESFSVNEKNRKILGIMSGYFDKTKLFDEIYSMRFFKLIQEIEKIEKKSKRLQKNHNKMHKEIQNYKLDLIGIIAGILSIFTIFGVNYSILTESFVEVINDNPVKLFLMWFIFNLGLLFLIRAMFSGIKEYFGTYVQDFELEKNREKTKKEIFICFLKNKNVQLLILILFLLLLLFVVWKISVGHINLIIFDF